MICRKVDDLQFTVEETSIDKGDLEVMPFLSLEPGSSCWFIQVKPAPNCTYGKWANIKESVG